ncbi:MAG TPA: GDSL-type esterase/lipase family protein [Chthoniobacterales bacterium]|nr:GDSL-type esterase/lipase family protein [Chthoniobacterales bacterium]
MAAPMRVVAFGDSGVYGYGVARNETYPAQLEAMLRQKGYEVTVINHGVNGMTSANAVAYVGNVGQADVVIVQVGVNDAKQHVPPGTIRQNVGWVIDKLKANGARVLVVSNPLADLCDVASSKGAPCVKWGGRAPDTQYVVPGDRQQHFNAAGLHILALKILPVLEKLLVAKH